jgi:hypothetical protein
VGWFSSAVRLVQSGFIYHYAIAMIVGVAGCCGGSAADPALDRADRLLMGAGLLSAAIGFRSV